MTKEIKTILTGQFAVLAFTILGGVVAFLLGDGAQLLIFGGGGESRFKFDAYTDKEIEGASIINIIDADGVIEYTYQLNEEITYPFVGIYFQDRNDSLLNLSDYHALSIVFDVEEESVVKLSFEKYIGIDDLTQTFTYSLNASPTKSNYTVPLSKFRTPDWWLKNNKIVALNNAWSGTRILSFNINHLQNSSARVRLREIALKEKFSFAYFFLPLVLFVIGQVVVLLLRKKGRIVAIEQEQLALNNKAFPIGVDKVVPFVETYFFKRNFSSLDVAQALRITQREVELEIEKKTAMKFKDYLQKLRIDMAKELLKNSNDRAFEIALKTGFNNAANFSQVFKQITGETPNSFRKRV